MVKMLCVETKTMHPGRLGELDFRFILREMVYLELVHLVSNLTRSD